jgi:hypothetical protein
MQEPAGCLAAIWQIVQRGRNELVASHKGLPARGEFPPAKMGDLWEPT